MIAALLDQSPDWIKHAEAAGISAEISFGDDGHLSFHRRASDGRWVVYRREGEDARRGAARGLLRALRASVDGAESLPPPPADDMDDLL